MEKGRRRTRRLVILAMMLALTVVLSWVEHSLPPIPGLPPGVRIGLANIVTMYVLFFVGVRDALCLYVLKSLFVLCIRGGTAGLLSLCGGLLSLGFVVLVMYIGRRQVSYFVLSILGAVGHNMGQLAMVRLLIGTGFAWYYAPVLILSGVVMGCVTGTLLRVVMPLFNNIQVRR